VNESDRRPFGLVFFAKNQRCAQLCNEVARWLQNERIPFFVDESSVLDLVEVDYLPTHSLASQCQYIIVIGGDGSILRASRYCARYGSILVGLHGGTKGFLTQLDDKNWKQGFYRLLEGNFRLQKRLMLSAQVLRGNSVLKKFIALNEAVIKVSSISRIMNFRLEVNGSLVDEYPGDGILISTPTGSTGYSLSAGGPLIQPEHELLLMSPICTHRFKARPCIFRSGDELVVEVLPHSPWVASEVALTLDGQEGYHLEAGDRVRVVSSRYKVKMAVLFEQDFFATLRSKID